MPSSLLFKWIAVIYPIGTTLFEWHHVDNPRQQTRRSQHFALFKTIAKAANKSNTPCQSSFLSITLHMESGTSYAQSMQSSPQNNPKLSSEGPKRWIGPIPFTTHSCSTTVKSTALFLYFLLLSVALSIPYGLISFSSQLWYHQAIVFYPCLFFRSVRWYLGFRAALSILNAVPLITSIGLPNMRLTRGFLTLISTLPNRSSSTPMWKTKAARPRCFCFSIAVPILSVWMRKTCCVCFPLLIGLIR